MTKKAKNILFIMFDQLRYDYLSCTGHPSLNTPHLDALAGKGVRFSHCYVQSPICGASRMSFYTGRYVHSHGAAWNNFPLKVGEVTLGDHLRERGMDSWLIGKTHMNVDQAGMDRLGISRDGVIGARVAECGFDVFLRDDGLWGEGPKGFYDKRRSPYNEYLKGQGYEAENPWQHNANAGLDEDGSVASGWFMRHADKPANIKEEDSETPWLTGQAIEFIQTQDANSAGPWMCHLSYIKPHWPYIVPAPYHDMYRAEEILPVVRSDGELQNPHPVYEQFMQNEIGQTFSKPGVREKVIPAYMGLIKQADDQMGRLFNWLEEAGHMEDTMIVVTSDHGDYLGDHWMGEKDLFHDPSVRVPLIIYDPSHEADATRGTVCDALVESIDLAATFVDLAGGDVPDHIIEGRSLLPFLHGQPPETWREYVVSEYDYSATPEAAALGLDPKQARLFMLADKGWKFIFADGGFRPLLFDLKNDPNELNDLGADLGHAEVINMFMKRLSEWARRPSQRTTVSSDTLLKKRDGSAADVGIFIGVYDERELPYDVIEKTIRRR
ncbi:sulfatase-like hydrolase/transferase [Ruegeria sp. A3M17]|uniref:sulfatase-like hydrolase/transferase n=1 Tax=Ruegeria sp. A3M17 TaxID=2267229 RepID=UPI000DE9D1A3|nr:sulfatase-like hydrolase/transferase [Ruegeria sp. A3M17]RBW63319.1 phosphonate monoester hydrolase [Ruegeria sp. A3M17]